nr:type II 3-dehydroquinate dehydratase [Desulfosporosinus youngiae]
MYSMGPDYFLIINPGTWTHHSYAVQDAIISVQVPAIKVHLSNIHTQRNMLTDCNFLSFRVGSRNLHKTTSCAEHGEWSKWLEEPVDFSESRATIN